MLRKAAVFAAEEGQEIVVDDRHLDEAIRELVLCGGGLTKSLLAAHDLPRRPSPAMILPR
ncbi:hypothetical protein ACSRUE_03685 [Sorangium sp. KYC3313]|uniref:hypothetical protein n=1 Tax=Sorangium sp. KYC3313 TaxID=3449740 RepID=UPI003F8BCF3B